MAEREDIAEVDAPEPEQVLSDAPGRRREHEPTDSDDRTVELTDPASPDPPIDDDHRDPARHGPVIE
jgi:hypothetical protein